MSKRRKRRYIVVAVLIAIAAVAWVVPYDFLSCKPSPTTFITSCFIPNALLSIFRAVPLGFALLIVLRPANRDS
jgi:hypothetical protein